MVDDSPKNENENVDDKSNEDSISKNQQFAFDQAEDSHQKNTQQVLAPKEKEDEAVVSKDMEIVDSDGEEVENPNTLDEVEMNNADAIGEESSTEAREKYACREKRNTG